MATSHDIMSVDAKAMEALSHDLLVFSKIAYPFATRETLTQAVMFAQREIQKHIQDQMELRNAWTRKSVLWNKPDIAPVDRQRAEVGSTQEYMKDQYEGFVKRSTGKHGYPLATSFAAGQYGANPRTKILKNPNKMARIQLQKFKKAGKTDKQRRVRRVQQAVEQGKRFVFLKFDRRKGIFKIVGGRKPRGRGFKKGWPEGARLKMVWDLTHKGLRTASNDWMEKPVEKTNVNIPMFYKKAINFQMKRLGILTTKGHRTGFR